MRINTIGYCLKQGLRNIFKNKIASLFSFSIIVATVFLFSVAYAAMMNVNCIVDEAQSSVGLTVFFDEGLEESRMKAIGDEIAAQPNVDRLVFTSAQEAWDKYKSIYFAGNEALAEGFEEDNPLANSASYEIFLKDISKQQSFVTYLEGLEGVRKVNYSAVLAGGLANVSRIIGYVTAGVLAVLLTIAIFLISNSITLSIAIRKEEIHIMRYIGATNGLIRMPFLIEGMLLGAVGAGIPLGIIYSFYDDTILRLRGMLSMFAGFMAFLSRDEIFRIIVPVALLLGIGIGCIGSLLSIRKHLRV